MATKLAHSIAHEIVEGLRVPLVTRQDTILSKLIWVSKDSEKLRSDIAAMLKRNGPINVAYISEQAATLSVEPVWGELRQKGNR